MKKILIGFTFCLTFSQLWAQGFSGAGGAPRFINRPGPIIDPYTFFSTGSYKINNVDSGDFSGLGIGAKIGFNTEKLWFGFDANMVQSDFSPNQNLAATTRDNHPLFDDNFILSYGIGMGINMGRLNLNYIHYFNQNYKGSVTDRTTGARGDYTYYGKGHKISLDYEFYEGFTIFAQHQISKFDRYSLTADINGVSQTGKTRRSADLELNTWNFGISYKIRFGTFQSLMQ